MEINKETFMTLIFYYLLPEYLWYIHRDFFLVIFLGGGGNRFQLLPFIKIWPVFSYTTLAQSRAKFVLADTQSYLRPERLVFAGMLNCPES